VIHKKGTKLDPPLRLDMSFDEALSRFVATNPEEVDESVQRSKTKRPPQDEAPRRSPEVKGRGRKPRASQR
jgi:hypothetical protein